MRCRAFGMKKTLAQQVMCGMSADLAALQNTSGAWPAMFINFTQVSAQARMSSHLLWLLPSRSAVSYLLKHGILSKQHASRRWAQSLHAFITHQAASGF